MSREGEFSRVSGENVSGPDSETIRHINRFLEQRRIQNLKQIQQEHLIATAEQIASEKEKSYRSHVAQCAADIQAKFDKPLLRTAALLGFLLAIPSVIFTYQEPQRSSHKDAIGNYGLELTPRATPVQMVPSVQYIVAEPSCAVHKGLNTAKPAPTPSPPC